MDKIRLICTVVLLCGIYSFATAQLTVSRNFNSDGSHIGGCQDELSLSHFNVLLENEGANSMMLHNLGVETNPANTLLGIYNADALSPLSFPVEIEPGESIEVGLVFLDTWMDLGATSSATISLTIQTVGPGGKMKSVTVDFHLEGCPPESDTPGNLDDGGRTRYAQDAPTTPIGIAPNPTSNEFTVSYHLDEEADVDIALYDATGQLIGNIVRSRQSKGDYNEPSSLLESMPTGMYFLISRINGEVHTERIVKQ